MIHHRFQIIGYIMVFIALVPMVIFVGDFDKSSSSADTTTSDIISSDSLSKMMKVDYNKKTINEKGETIKTITKIENPTFQKRRDPVSFILQLFSLIGLILIIMSKEKVDDERLEKLRLIAFRDSFIVLLILSIASIVLAYFGVFNEKSPLFLILNAVFLFYLTRYYLLKVK